MKKLFKLFLVIVLFYLLFNMFINKNTNTINYQVKNIETFNIKEVYENNKYYYEININGITFNFDVNYKLKKKNVIDVKTYKDSNYICILPVFESNKTYTDIICKKNDIQYLYNTMEDKPYDLVQFRNNLIDIYRNSEISSEFKSLGFLKIYTDNFEENKYVIVNNYKGVYLLSKNYIKDVALFNSDVYNQNIKGVIEKYYIIADYNEKHEFSKFNIVDIETGKISVLKTKYKISIESVLQGIYNNKLYIYDEDNKKQYEVDPLKMTCNIVGTDKKGIKLYNTEFKTYKISEIKDFRFNFDKYEENLKTIDGDETYYYLSGDYIYKKYYASENKTTLFKNIYNEIKYNKDYICALKDSDIYCYDGINSVKKMLNYKELLFNRNITFYAYRK